MNKTLLACMGAGVLWVSSALAQTADDRTTIINSCLSELKLSEPGCACIADRAESDLEPGAHHLLAVALSDPAAVGTIAATTGVTPDQVQAMGMFMVTVPTQCAQATMQ